MTPMMAKLSTNMLGLKYGQVSEAQVGPTKRFEVQARLDPNKAKYDTKLKDIHF